MDIQKMIDDRIGELLAKSNRTQNSPGRQGEIFSDDLEDLGKLIDASMIEVAERVLAISDRVAGDYARMEKNILDSRLAVLQTAESVLDIAVSLRRKAKAMIARNDCPVPQTNIKDDELQLLRDFRDLEFSGMEVSRASMHDQGVASLFKRT